MFYFLLSLLFYSQVSGGDDGAHNVKEMIDAANTAISALDLSFTTTATATARGIMAPPGIFKEEASPTLLIGAGSAALSCASLCARSISALVDGIELMEGVSSSYSPRTAATAIISLMKIFSKTKTDFLFSEQENNEEVVEENGNIQRISHHCNHLLTRTTSSSSSSSSSPSVSWIDCALESGVSALVESHSTTHSAALIWRDLPPAHSLYPLVALRAALSFVNEEKMKSNEETISTGTTTTTLPVASPLPSTATDTATDFPPPPPPPPTTTTATIEHDDGENNLTRKINKLSEKLSEISKKFTEISEKIAGKKTIITAAAADEKKTGASEFPEIPDTVDFALALAGFVAGIDARQFHAMRENTDIEAAAVQRLTLTEKAKAEADAVSDHSSRTWILNISAIHAARHERSIAHAALSQLTGGRGLASWLPSKSSLDKFSDLSIARSSAIRAAFANDWDTYANFAWGYDVLKPISKKGATDLCQMGETIVDGTDTAILMGLPSQFIAASEWVGKNLSARIGGQADISTFECTIRVVGGLLGTADAMGLGSAHGALHYGASEAVMRAMIEAGAFNSPTGIPYSTLYLAPRKQKTKVGGGENNTTTTKSSAADFFLGACLPDDLDTTGTVTSSSSLQSSSSTSLPGGGGGGATSSSSSVLPRLSREVPSGAMNGVRTPCGHAYNPGFAGGSSSVAEAGTLQLELSTLSMRIAEGAVFGRDAGVATYAFHALGLRAVGTMIANQPLDGLFPIYVNPQSGLLLKDAPITLGARGDSLYEYFFKEWLLLGGWRAERRRARALGVLSVLLNFGNVNYYENFGQKLKAALDKIRFILSTFSGDDPRPLLDSYNNAIAGIMDRLLRNSTPSKLTFVGEQAKAAPPGQSVPLIPKMDHLVCFLPGLLALGVSNGAGHESLAHARETAIRWEAGAIVLEEEKAAEVAATEAAKTGTSSGRASGGPPLSPPLLPKHHHWNWNSASDEHIEGDIDFRGQSAASAVLRAATFVPFSPQQLPLLKMTPPPPPRHDIGNNNNNDGGDGDDDNLVFHLIADRVAKWSERGITMIHILVDVVTLLEKKASESGLGGGGGGGFSIAMNDAINVINEALIIETPKVPEPSPQVIPTTTGSPSSPPSTGSPHEIESLSHSGGGGGGGSDDGILAISSLSALAARVNTIFLSTRSPRSTTATTSSSSSSFTSNDPILSPFASNASPLVARASLLRAARSLLHTCVAFYDRSPTGLAPEIVTFHEGADFEPNADARHSFLRPETLESLFILRSLGLEGPRRAIDDAFCQKEDEEGGGGYWFVL